MTEQNSLDKFRSKEVEERFQELISGIVNEEFENMNNGWIPASGMHKSTAGSAGSAFIKGWKQESARMQVHGGAVSGMMDTAMGMSIMAKSGRPVTTAELNIKLYSCVSGRELSDRYQRSSIWEEISSEQDPLLTMKNQESFLLQRQQILLM